MTQGVLEIIVDTGVPIMKKALTSCTLAAALVTGCATSPDNMKAAYVSPLKYSTYDCTQIVMEMDHVSKRTTELYESLDTKADRDAAQMGIGLILFWPTLFLLEGGDGPEAAEYANLKGDFEALRTAAVQKKCSQDMMPKSPEELIKEAQEAKKQAAESSSSGPNIY